MRDSVNIIAEKISKRRKELGLTQKELAEKLNISDKTLSRWETGKQVPDALMIPEIAKALDISIHEIYGVAHTNNEHISSSDKIDYSRITSYKLMSLLSLLLFAAGYVIYSHTGFYWHYMKVGSMIPLGLSAFLFLAAELSFEEFYTKTSNSDIYRVSHMKWLGSVIPITGFIVGVIIPIFKTRATTMFNNIDVIFPLVIFQGVILIFYVKRHLHNRKQGVEEANFLGIYALAFIAVIFSGFFIFYTLSNPYRTEGSFVYDWQIGMIEKRIKACELGVGISSFFMNLLHSKIVLEVLESSFKKVFKIISMTTVILGAIMMATVLILNYNMRSKVTYEIKELTLSELTNDNRNLLSWIQECNITGNEINIESSYRYDSENKKDITCYLIYMPHGYKDTELKVNYYLGIGGKVLKLDFKNTTQFVDDNYYLCYLEVINNTGSLELQTYLDGEAVSYNNSGYVDVKPFK